MTAQTLDLAAITKDHFKSLIGSTFKLELEGNPSIAATIVLNKMTEYPETYKTSGRSPFSLVFVGPSNSHFAQNIYTLTNETLGTINLFLVPVGIGPGGVLFEAVFN